MRLFLVAGEPSGDLLGGRLMQALRSAVPDIDFVGLGGEAMRRQGLKTLFPMEELAVMGLAEVVPRLPRLMRRLSETVDAVERSEPAALITIDAPDFNFRLGQRLKRRGFPGPHIHYVAPTVWAWRPGRAKKVAGFLDHLLALLPFEPPYFEAEGLACSFVGHPALEATQKTISRGEARKALGLDGDSKIMLLLPGSRQGELNRLLPAFVATLERLQQDQPATILVPSFARFVPQLEAATRTLSTVRIVVAPEDKQSALAAGDLALAASGTVGLELALHGVPHVVAYRLAPVTALLARRLVRTRYVHLANILTNKPAVPEFLQDQVDPERMAAALRRLMRPSAAAEQERCFTEVRAMLQPPNGEPPSAAAAKTILRAISARKQAPDDQSGERENHR